AVGHVRARLRVRRVQGGDRPQLALLRAAGRRGGGERPTRGGGARVRRGRARTGGSDRVAVLHGVVNRPAPTPLAAAGGDDPGEQQQPGGGPSAQADGHRSVVI